LLTSERVSRALIRRTGWDGITPWGRQLAILICVGRATVRDTGSVEPYTEFPMYLWIDSLGIRDLVWLVGNRVSRALIRRTAQIEKEKRGVLIQ
jgi:hypothetical protein